MFKMRLSRAAKATIKRLAKQDRYPRVRTGFLTDAGPCRGTTWMDPTDPSALMVRVDRVEGGKVYCHSSDGEPDAFPCTVAKWLELVAEGRLMLVGLELVTHRTEFWAGGPWP